MTLFRVLFVFLALCAVLDCQLVCEEMRLEHTECHTVNRGPIVQNPDYPQEVIWVEALQEQISDIRMIPADCRRGLVWYICNSAFPQCGEYGLPCFPDDQSCPQVAAACAPYGIPVNCSSNGPAYPGCNTTIILNEVIQEPIPVETCVSEKGYAGNTVNCCNDPFGRDDGGECIVECYLYSFSESSEKGLATYAYFMTWFSLIVCVIALTPVMIMVDMRELHNQTFPLIAFTTVCSLLTMTWSMYPGREEYICEGHMAYDEAIDAFLTSDKCAVNAFFFTFFTISNAYWVLVLAALMLDRFIKKTPMSETQQTSMKKIIIVHIIGWGHALAFAIAMLVLGLDNHIDDDGEWVIVFGIIEFHCHANPNSVAYYLQWLPRTIEVGFSMLGIIIALGIVAKANWRLLLHYQWRTVLCVFHIFVLQVLIEVMLYGVGTDWSTEIDQTASDYAMCVASNPRTSDPPCSKEEVSAFGFLVLWVTVFYISPALLVSYVYLTNKMVLNFYFYVFKFHELPRMSDVTGSTASMSSKRSTRSAERSTSAASTQAPFSSNQSSGTSSGSVSADTPFV